MSNKNTGAAAGLGFGAVLAIVLSWSNSQAIVWTIFHGVLGWLYVIYYLITKDGWTWF